VVGRAGMDLYACPRATKIQNSRLFSAQLGGSAGNIAVGLAKQNKNVSILAGISDDAIGTFTSNLLNSFGVKTNLLVRIKNKRNTLAIVDTRGEDTQAVIYRDSAADLFISNKITDSLNIETFSTIITTGTALTNQPSRDAVLSLMKKGKAQNKNVIFDIDYRAHTWDSNTEAFEVLKKAGEIATTIVGNETEFEFMAGHKDGLNHAEKLHKSGTETVIYKMGSKGSILFTKNVKANFGVFKVKALKPTGAGDAFLAGYCASLAKSNDINMAILNGSATAAIVVSQVGCSESLPDTKQLEKFINKNNSIEILKD